MAKGKKKQSVVHKKVEPPQKKGVGLTTWIAGSVAVVAVVVVIVLASGAGNTAPSGAAAAAAAPVTSAPGVVPAEEAKYIGRLLPAKYAETSVADPATYSTVVKMTDVTPSRGAKQTTLSAADVVADKIVYFEYPKAGSDPISMIAYVKPSGKLFVGVGFCIPCKGKRQRIESDGTLTCEACGTKRDLETGVGISGTCRLYPLDEVPATVVGGKIVIDNAVLDQWTAQPLDRPTGV